MTAYYNEFDPKAAAWLRELIKAGHIAPGVVDERSIADVRPADLIGYTQCHFFAGIGVWSHALRLAGWPDDRPVWTGSCPCQPFSAAGKGAGFTDERHLWPHFHWLIENCRPPVVFGEQVASKDGLGWLDLVQADLEGSGYTSGAVDTCAAGFGAPHIRQRLYWVGKRLDDATSARHVRAFEKSESNSRDETRMCLSGEGSGPSGLADADGRDACAERQQHGGEQRFLAKDGSALREGCEGARLELGRMADTNSGRGQSGVELCQSDNRFDDRATRGLADAHCSGRKQKPDAECAGIQSETLGPRPTGKQLGDDHTSGHRPRSTRPTNGFWSDADWLFCRDGKWRPVEPGTFPLAHGAAERVGRLRGYGNAINAEQAQAFIEAADECLRLTPVYEKTTDKGVFG